MQIYNTLTRRKELFTPLDSKHVRMYVCGNTMYDLAHIGNARPVVIFDTLYRFLKQRYAVTYVRNITDVDDKINAAARKTGRAIQDITEEYTQAYHQDMGQLNVYAPTVEPRATHHIPQMITMIEDLITKGHAYEAEGHVLFEVSSLPSYGALSNRSLEDMIAGARVEVAPYKKNPADFVLWKPSDDQTPGWESPWGFGRPGWHIECSAMSTHYLGETFDLHCGGRDLIFPHHENEVAQSVGCHGEGTFAQYWMHNGILEVNGEKMSKSLGNFITLRDALKHYPGEVIRLALLSAHYRQPLNWTNQLMEQSRSTLNRLYTSLKGSQPLSEADKQKQLPAEFQEALEDDLNTPLALSYLHKLAGNINKAADDREKSILQVQLWACGAVLGILQEDPAVWFQGDLNAAEDEDQISATSIEALIAERQHAKSDRNFGRADEIRKALAEQGVILEDTPIGTTWRRS